MYDSKALPARYSHSVKASTVLNSFHAENPFPNQHRAEKATSYPKRYPDNDYLMNIHMDYLTI